MSIATTAVIVVATMVATIAGIIMVGTVISAAAPSGVIIIAFASVADYIRAGVRKRPPVLLPGQRLFSAPTLWKDHA